MGASEDTEVTAKHGEMCILHRAIVWVGEVDQYVMVSCDERCPQH